MARITVVNDNPEFLELMSEVLESERYETTTVDGGRPDVLDLVRSSRPDLLIIDLRLGNEGLHGWGLVQQIREEQALEGLPILLNSADLQALHEVEPVLEGRRPIEVLAKPFGIDELTATIDRLLAESVGR